MSTGPNPDRIELTVATSLLPGTTSKVAVELKNQLLQDLKKEMSTFSGTGISPTVTGRRVFQEGGRTFEVTGKAKTIQREGEEAQLVQLQLNELANEQLKLDKIENAQKKRRVARGRREINVRKQAIKEHEQFIEATQVPLDALEENARRTRKQIDTEETKARNKRTQRGKKELDARVQAVKEHQEYLSSTQFSIEGLESQAIGLRKKLNADEKKIQRQKRKEFMDDFDLAQAQLKFNQEQFQQSFVPIQGLEKQATTLRKQLDTEKRRIDKQKRKEFKDDFDLAQAQLKFNREQFQQSFVSVGDLEKQAQSLRRDLDKGKRQAKIAADQAATARRLQFQNTALVAASAGIGVLGTAGFPLLNVAFAAMSGGPVGAGIAAASTAIGEFSRRMNQLATDTMNTAKELGFVSTNFKKIEIQSKAISAFAGFGVQSSEAAAMRIRSETRRSAEGQDWLRFWNDLGKTVGTQFEEALLKPFSQSRTPFWETFARQREESARLITPENMQSARRNMVMQMNQGAPGIEHDPYLVWQRIQNAALDPQAHAQAEIWREAIKEIDKQMLEELKKLNNNLSPHLRTTRGDISFGVSGSW